MDYKEQLKNQLWLNKKAEILKRDNYRCTNCGSILNLQVHHKRYISGRMAWDYDNNDLITLCRNCHYSIHSEELKASCTDLSISTKNFVIYRSIMSDDNFKPNERILYSIFSAYALYQNKHNNNNWYEYKVENVRKFCRELNITSQTFYRTQKDLCEKDLIRGNLIYIPKSLTEKGFIKLQGYDKTGGLLLIFYSYLKDKSNKYGGTIDTYKTKLAECLDTTKIAITKLLNRLYALNLAKRLNNGKLMIL